MVNGQDYSYSPLSVITDPRTTTTDRKIIQSSITSNVAHLYLRFKSDLSAIERLGIMLTTIFRQTESTQLHMQVSWTGV